MTHERRKMFGAALSLGSLMAGHVLLETGRDALFLAKLPAAHLPWVYLAMTAVALGLIELDRRIGERHRRGRALPGLLTVSAIVTFGFWLLSDSPSPLLLYALYVWTGASATIILARFWMAIDVQYTVTEAKRAFGPIGAGSVGGAIAGSIGARAATEIWPQQHVLALAALMMCLTAVAAVLFLDDGGVERRSSHSMLEAARTVADEPFLMRVLLLLLISTATLTLVDFAFKNEAARSVAPGALGSFFATWSIIFNVSSLVVQVFAVGWMLRTFGLHRTSCLLPALLILSAGFLLIGGGLVAALALKSADGGLRHSLHRTSVELLYVPVRDEVRARSKGLIDTVGQRGGQALGSIVLLALIATGTAAWSLPLLVLALAAAWATVALDLREHYLSLFRAAVRERRFPTRRPIVELDASGRQALLEALNSRDDGDVLAAIDLLAEHGSSKLIPPTILYHPATPIVLRALEVFERADRTDCLPIIGRLLEHPNAEVRAGALRIRSRAHPEKRELEAAMNDESSIVRATALVAMIAEGWIAGENASELVVAVLREHQLSGCSALVRAIRGRKSGNFQTLVALVLQALLPMLADRADRPSARWTLHELGDGALDFLARALDDPALSPKIRRHIPRTLTGFEPQSAVRVLAPHLLDDRDGKVRWKTLRALNRIQTRAPEVTLDPKLIQRGIDLALATAFRLREYRYVLNHHGRPFKTRAQALLLGLIDSKYEEAIERLFRMLQLGHPNEDFRRIHRSLESESTRVRAIARELVAGVLDDPTRDDVLALIDQPHGETPTAISYEHALREMIEEGGETLALVAEYHARELRDRERAFDREASYAT